MQRLEKETPKRIKTGRKGAVREDAHCEVPLSLLGGGEGALSQKILRFSGNPCVGLEGRGVGLQSR